MAEVEDDWDFFDSDTVSNASTAAEEEKADDSSSSSSPALSPSSPQHAQIKRQDVECPVCHSYYKCPVLLKCSHNLCSECANKCLSFQSIRKQDGNSASGGQPPALSLQCPLCDLPTLQKELVYNPALGLRVSQYEDSKVLCARCDPRSNTEATLECLKCELAYCKSCHLVMHPPGRVCFESHMSAAVGTLEKQQKLKNQRSCKEHNMMLELYCKDHQVLVCLCCAQYGDHKPCSCEALELVAHTITAGAVKGPLQQTLPELSTWEQQLKLVLDKVDNNEDQTARLIRAWTESQQQKLQKASEDLLQNLRAQVACQKELLLRQTTGLQAASEEAKALIDESSESGQDSFLKVQSLIRQRLLFAHLDEVRILVPDPVVFEPSKKEPEIGTLKVSLRTLLYTKSGQDREGANQATDSTERAAA
eukprot:gb/GEZN01009558.1/.p1 GENE.gb/GEZN01009558.1/~~gb/GEZN01009558.1/.p1  ORF type:complete len:421 (+),score=51.39 gb/GEZN01009558.1/:26-1288(+)